MKYFAKDLRSVYGILETLPKPLAVLDFMCGTVGCEFAVSQSVGGEFYDKWSRNVRVVALCWEGASFLYSNVSDDQIEFTDKALSRLGDRDGKGWKRKHWLDEQGHEGRIATMAGIVAHCGPYDVSAKAMGKYYKLDTSKQWLMVKERLTRTGYVFSTRDPPLIQEPYIAIFDRNERLGPNRNTHVWQVELFRHWAQSFGFKLVVISDFYPRHHQDVISVPFADRNLDRLCNIIHHSTLYAAPASGSGCAGWVFGCNFVGLMMGHDFWITLTGDVVPSMLEERGFRYFGILDSPDTEVANKVGEYLKEKRVV